jgi:hypothetical protein
MKKTTGTLLMAVIPALALMGGAVAAKSTAHGKARSDKPKVTQPATKGAIAKPTAEPAGVTASGPLDPFVQRGADWLVKAQHPGGGWGAGSHARQEVRDPRQVVVDPATTAFVAMALLRTGSTPESGPYREALVRATTYLVEVVEKAPKDGPRITDLEGTQPQAKLGPLVDTGMTSQYLARVLPLLAKGTDLHQRVDKALDRCVAKLEASQSKDGNWNSGGGWAPGLQSSVSTSALEMAQVAGKTVDGDKLDKARQYQKGQYDAKSGRTESRDTAGVELYAFSSAQRANAAEASDAQKLLKAAKEKGALPKDAPVTEDNLKKAGVNETKARDLSQAYQANAAQLRRMSDEQLLTGFGSNGGEEYLSYLQTSESLVLAGEAQWADWKGKMTTRLAKIQSEDGSWTGHHCITSPVFCTAAVLQTLTADRDPGGAQKVARAAGKD